MERVNNMKIGILSMQKVKNYGSFLQAFALKKTIESFGHEVEFVDILPGKQLQEYKMTLKWRVIRIMEAYFSFYIIHRRRFWVNYKKTFDSFFDGLGTEKHTINAYDCVVIGSDEVFNIAQPATWGYTTHLFGNISNAKKVISYAGCFGQTSFDFIQRNNLTESITLALKNMSAISVRDYNSKMIVESLLHIAPSVHIDPVLFFDFSENIKEKLERNYILIYSYPNRIKDKKVVKAIKTLAKKHNKKILSIGSFYEWADDVLLPHPFEVLSYFKNADYVITDTFHGAVMSIKYNKQVVVLVRDSNRNKIEYLLESVKLKELIAENYFDIERILSRQIDYSETNTVIKNETQRSLEYLQVNL